MCGGSRQAQAAAGQWGAAVAKLGPRLCCLLGGAEKVPVLLLQPERLQERSNCRAVNAHPFYIVSSAAGTKARRIATQKRHAGPYRRGRFTPSSLRIRDRAPAAGSIGPASFRVVSLR